MSTRPLYSLGSRHLIGTFHERIKTYIVRNRQYTYINVVVRPISNIGTICIVIMSIFDIEHDRSQTFWRAKHFRYNRLKSARSPQLYAHNVGDLPPHTSTSSLASRYDKIVVDLCAAAAPLYNTFPRCAFGSR